MKKPKSILLLFLALFLVTIPDKGYTQETRVANEQEQNEFLQLHIQYRIEVGVDSISWSNELAQYALEWADVLGKKYNCEMRHRPRSGKYTQQHGENIYTMWGGEPDIVEVMDNWAKEEKPYYNGEPIGKIKSNHTTGHYTQIVWNNTQQVGCARTVCTNRRDRITYIWVCNYNPPGNWVGEKPYHKNEK